MEVTLDLGNGTVQTIPMPFNESLHLTRRYWDHANYTICVSDRNLISFFPNTCTKLIVQKPLMNITLQCPHTGDIDEGNMTCQLVPDMSAGSPGEVFGNWMFADSDSVIRYLTLLFLGQLEPETHFYDSSFIGTHLLSVNMYNFISSLNVSSNFTFHKPVDNITLDTDKNATTPGSCIYLTVDIDSGSHLNFDIDLGDQNGFIAFSYEDMATAFSSISHNDSTTEFVLNPNVTLKVRSCSECFGSSYQEWLGYVYQAEIKMCYPVQGDYRPEVVVFNGLGNVTVVLSYDLEIAILLNESLALNIPRFVPKPTGVTLAEFTVLPNKYFEGKLACHWIYESQVVNVSHIYILNDYDNILVSLDALPAGHACGEVECENALSSQVIPFCTIIEEEINNVTMSIRDSTLSLGADAYFDVELATGTYQGSLDFGDTNIEFIPLQSDKNFTIVHQYYDPGYFTAEVHLWNNFSEGNATVSLVVQPIIRRIRIDGPPNVAVGTNGSLMIIGTHNLTAVVHTWTATDTSGILIGNRTAIDDPEFTFPCHEVGFLDVFAEVRNFISEANASMEVFCAELLGDIEIRLNQELILTNISRTGKSSHSEYCVRVLTDNSSVTFTWFVSGCGKAYEETFNLTEPCLVFPFIETLCLFNVTLQVTNPVGHKVLSVDVEVMETISLGPMKVLSPCLPRVRIRFRLQLHHDATRPCYTIDYGDASDLVHIGSGCDPTIVTTDSTVVLSSTSLTYGHTYADLGAYYLTVRGVNDVSEDEETIRLPVNAEPCKQLDLSIMGMGHDINQPRAEQKSQIISLLSKVVVDCNATVDIVYLWTIVDSAGDPVPLDGERHYLDIPGNFLACGTYTVSLEAFLSGMFGTDDTDEITLAVEPSPLTVRTIPSVSLLERKDSFLTLRLSLKTHKVQGSFFTSH